MGYYSDKRVIDAYNPNYTVDFQDVGFGNLAPSLYASDGHFSADYRCFYNVNISSLGSIRLKELYRQSNHTAIGGMPSRALKILFGIPVYVNGDIKYWIDCYYRTQSNATSAWSLRVLLENYEGSEQYVSSDIPSFGFSGLVGSLPIVQHIGGHDYIGIITYCYKDSDQRELYAPQGGIFTTLNVKFITDWLDEEEGEGNYEIKYADLWEEAYGDPSDEGGYTGGTFDDSSDTISIPTAPTLGVTSAGFVNVYAPTSGELNQFGSELFPDLSFTPVSQGGTPSSVTDALVSMAQVLVDFGNQIPEMIDMYINSNLINYVIDCHVIPVSPQVSGTAPVKVGFKTFTPTPSVVTSDYVDFDCGTLNVGEYYANFIDYLPYTRAKLYLPFVGFIDLAPEYWQSGSLNVTYRFNIIDGSFVAFVKSTSSKSNLSDSVIGQFGGNACVHIPITGLNYASMVSGIVGAMSPLLPSATGGVGDALVNSANAIANNKPNLQQSNGYNATTSFLTVRFPYLLIERSVSNFSRNYAEEDGIPSNITLDFSSLSGLTKATMLHLDGISGATEDDLDEIASLLSEGVIL